MWCEIIMKKQMIATAGLFEFWQWHNNPQNIAGRRENDMLFKIIVFSTRLSPYENSPIWASDAGAVLINYFWCTGSRDYCGYCINRT